MPERYIDDQALRYSTWYKPNKFPSDYIIMFKTIENDFSPVLKIIQNLFYLTISLNH